MNQKTIVINLTRFGDLLQTQPVFTALKARGRETALVCLENFASAAKLMRDVDAVFALPGAALLSQLDDDWRRGLGTFCDWAGNDLASFGADQVVNLTSTLPGRLLARYLAPCEVVGYALDEFGFADNTSPWAAFLVASSRNRGCSPFNLVDLFHHVAGYGQEPGAQSDGPAHPVYRLREPDTAATAAVRGVLTAEGPADAPGYIAIQLGASADFRRWPVAHFARLAELVHERTGLCPVLLGSGDEAPLAERFRAACRVPSASLVGRTSLVELAAALGLVRMLVTNDTGTMHLAAGLGVPVCAVFLATAQPWDTGPYSSDALCIEPDMPCHPCGFGKTCPTGFSCRHAVQPEAVAAFVHARLDRGRWELESGASRPEGIRVWEMRPGADGFMGLVSRSGHEDADRTVWVRQQRHFYCRFLDGEPISEAGAPRFAGDSSVAETVRAELEQAERLFHLLGEQAVALSKVPLPPLKKRFMASFERLTGLLCESRYLSVLGDMWREQAHGLGDDFSRMPALAERYQRLCGQWCRHLAPLGMQLETD
ncbi:ADP-heptose:LPS heptosyltransferase [Desulfobaculum xiamenense]|uniref:ADP-heptose:LPS heptosyltransferase n=1 Tax=Desulfobaculum xiamenense TaxID=995050 RepID=A0A846QQ93_9BACT|nr:glycosyltransferase family 9 protein [Desulfobaculum xiamenense]NJB69347.1 ADP-heptose:LPS heptosyltransferase [Desulfobaculum xiamenense]